MKRLVLFLLCFQYISVLANHPTLVDEKIIFIENKGQWDSEIHFIADIPGGKLLIKSDGFSYLFEDRKEPNNESFDPSNKKSHDHHIVRPSYSSLDVSLIEAQYNYDIQGISPTKTTFNYYQGNDPEKWGEACRAYESIILNNVYDGIHMKFYSNGKNLKYDFIVEPKADPNNIGIQYAQKTNPYLEDGCAFIKFNDRTIMENRPIAFQTNDKAQKSVSCNYRLDHGTIKFQIDKSYNKKKTLIIDPELIFSTFSGAESDNFGFTACYDDDGNLYSGGIIFGGGLSGSVGNSFAGGLTDIAVLKYDSTGADLLYATFIGGSSVENPHSFIVDQNNHLVILGTTGSTDFPTTPTAYDRTFNGGSPFSIFGTYEQGTDIVVTKLGDDGQLLHSTFIGGGGNDGILKMLDRSNLQNKLIYNYGDYIRGDIAIDKNNNVIIASSTDDSTFPMVNAIQSGYAGGQSDAVIFSLDETLSDLKWSTYLGGSNDDAAYSVRLNSSNHVIVAGGSASADFPTTATALNPTFGGTIDGFVTIFDPSNAKIESSTFLGTSAYDQAYIIDTDLDDNVYVFGQTKGDYPVSEGVYSNANSSQFIHKLNPSLSQTIFSTVIGSGVLEPNISPTAFLASDCDNIFLSGWGGNTNNMGSGRASGGSTNGLPVTSNAYSTTTDGSDFYLMVLSADAKKLMYATFFGSTNSTGDHVDGGTSRFDKRGIVYQSACSCGGSADNFPTTDNAWSTVNNGVNSDGIERCNNASFKFDLASLKALYATNTPEETDPGITNGCIPLSIQFTNASLGGEEFYWDFGDGSDEVESSSQVIHTFDDAGDYTITLKAIDPNTCQTEDIYKGSISAYYEAAEIGPSQTICSGDFASLVASGGSTYEWSPSIGLSSTTIANPIANPDFTTTYNVIINTERGCVHEKQVDVIVIPTIVEAFEITQTYGCDGQVIYHLNNQTNYDGNMNWDLGDGRIIPANETSFTYSSNGNYQINLEIEEACVLDHEINIEHEEVFIPNAFSPNEDGVNDTFVIQGPYAPDLIILDRSGKVLYEKNEYGNDWTGDNLPVGTYYFQTTFPGEATCKGWLQILR